MAALFDLSLLSNAVAQPLATITNPRSLIKGVNSGTRGVVSTTVTSYSLMLFGKSGNKSGPIGAVSSIAPQQTREIDAEFEVNYYSTGLPRELVPQTVGTRSIRIERYELYTARMMQIFGTSEWAHLGAQTDPISLRLYMRSPATSDIDFVAGQSKLSVWSYSGCWMSDFGYTARADGDIVLGSNATLLWTNCSKLQ